MIKLVSYRHIHYLNYKSKFLVILQTYIYFLQPTLDLKFCIFLLNDLLHYNLLINYISITFYI